MWRRLRDSPLSVQPMSREIQDAYRHQTLIVRLREAQLREVLDFFRSHRIEPVLFKGWAVGRRYPEAGLRPYGDLDLLLPPSQYRRARALWDGGSRPDAPVELHPSLPHLRDRSLEGLLERASSALLGDLEVRVLAPEDHFRLLALHALGHGLASPMWLCDLALLLEGPSRGEPTLDWERILTGDPWLTEGTWLALAITRDLLGTDLAGAGLPAPWAERPLPAWAHAAALDALGADSHYMDLPDPASLLLRPRTLARAARLRWANPLEATYRMEAPWDGLPRVAVQVADYARRGAGFLRAVSHHGGGRIGAVEEG